MSEATQVVTAMISYYCPDTDTGPHVVEPPLFYQLRYKDIVTPNKVTKVPVLRLGWLCNYCGNHHFMKLDVEYKRYIR